MIGPLSLEGVTDTGKRNTQYPLDLHWRKEPPFWGGNLGNIFVKTYPKFAGQVLCYQCGAIPCPYKHDDTEKKQRLTDMEFVKELARDRREMKTQIEEKESTLTELRVEQKKITEDNRLLTAKVEYYARLEEEWNRTKMQMESEIRRLNALNDENKELLTAMKKDAYQLQILRQKYDALEEENQRLTDELANCKRIMGNQSSEIETLTADNKEKTNQLASSKSKVNKLVIKVEESKLEVESLKNKVKEKDDEISRIENELRSIIEELAAKTKEFQINEMKNKKLIQTLRLVVVELQGTISSMDEANVALKARIRELEHEIDMLKKKLASDTRFKQFVEIKREYNTLRDASGTLAQKVQQYENEIPLPIVKKGGKLSARNKKVCGLGTRPRTAILNRPKSARFNMRPPTADSSVGDISDFKEYDDLSRPQSAAGFINASYSSRLQTGFPGSITESYADESVAYSERLTSLLGTPRSRTSIVKNSSVQCLNAPHSSRLNNEYAATSDKVHTKSDDEAIKKTSYTHFDKSRDISRNIEEDLCSLSEASFEFVKYE